DQGRPARSLPAEDLELIKDLHLLTAKPVLYVANVEESGLETNPWLPKLKALAAEEGAEVIPISAAVEAEIAALPEAERRPFLEDLGLTEPGLNRLIRAGYRLLGLQTFFTAGPKEVRAWTIPVGATAPAAAGVIHTAFERGFIRAEVVSYDDYIRCGGEQGAKEAAKWRREGREYVVQDGGARLCRYNG